MIHKMGLYEEYFYDIKSGNKQVEVRLFDEKRKNISLGDIIEFVILPKQENTLQVRVVELKNYSTFHELYKDIPFEEMGCEGWTMEKMLEGTYDIYTPDQVLKWGALAIRIQVMTS